jgi:selenocysteine-specific elongation factor
VSSAARVVVGTAGHIDHGKSALVRALTGVDPDRLPEERARGITIDLGFAELPGDGELQLGVVDVPGHENFVRTMVAGATGIDVVLLVVAADEGVMPQTSEHLDIVELLGVPEMVVALTKADLVDDEWRSLVEDDVRERLADTRYAAAPLVPTSATAGTGLAALLATLRAVARRGRRRDAQDLARLPVDRVFTLQGTGTVVTGTLWSGTLAQGERVRLLPEGPEARIRSLQVHGRDVAEARAGERTAVALTGAERRSVERGATVVQADGWEPTWMLTADVRVLAGSRWRLEHGLRVRVHVATAEVMARCVPLGDEVGPGDRGWVQLRLEAPVVARAGDRIVLRSYSPVTTVGGGVVAEPSPPKRKRLDGEERTALEQLVQGVPGPSVRAALRLAGWEGLAIGSLPVRAGCAPPEATDALRAAVADGAITARGTAFSAEVAADAEERVLAALDEGHRHLALRPSVPLDRLRGALPGWAPSDVADAMIERLRTRGELELAEGGARRPGYRPAPTDDQAEACRALGATYRQAGLAAPFLEELPEALRSRPDLPELLRHLEGEGTLRTVAEGLLYDAEVLAGAEAAVVTGLGGRKDLSPADFRDVLPVSRRHLMPLLAHLDGAGVTLRRGPLRDVPSGA